MPHKFKNNDVVNWRDALWCVFEVQKPHDNTYMLLRQRYVHGLGYCRAESTTGIESYNCDEVEATAYKHGETSDPWRTQDSLIASSRR